MQAEKKSSQLKKYIKDGKECVLCYSRKKLIQITPEEIVRQELVDKLINEYGVPKELITVEVPVAHYPKGKGKRGRADIVVSGIDKETFDNYPLMVIECKAPTIALTDKVFNQVVDYDAIIEPRIIVITNGLQTESYCYDFDKDDYLPIDKIPKYSDLISGVGINFVEEVEDDWERPNHKGNIKEIRELLLEDYNIGEDSNEKWVPFYTNFYGLLYDDKDLIKELKLTNKKFISDGGLRFTTFGNSAGGKFTGLYRYFIVEDENNDTEILSLSMMGKISVKNHPKWGNSNGYTLFNVAIDNFEQSHMSLEYSMDRFVKVDGENYSFWHDGTLTVGNLGRAKNIDVINFIKENNPNLIKDNKIYLGTIDNSLPFTWQNENVKNLIANFIDYGFVRDRFRQFRKNVCT